MSDLGSTVLSGIFPRNGEALTTARELLTTEHFRDPVEKVFFGLLDNYGERYGQVFPEKFLTDLLARQGFDAAKIVLYTELYSSYVSNEVSSSDFKYAVESLVDDMAKEKTGQAIALAMEVLERGADVGDGVKVQGHTAAREYLARATSEIEDAVSVEEAPEGDIRLEADQFMEMYERRALEPASNGVLSGIKALDDATGGLKNGEMCLVAGYTNEGKASPLWTPVLTPLGWTTMGQLSVGDSVVSSQGVPTTVSGVFDRGVMDTYRVTFGDASVVTAADHLWQVQDQNQRAGKSSGFRILTTLQLSEGISRGSRYYVPLVKPVQFVEADLPLDPYALGVILGDGCVAEGQHPSISCHEDDVQILVETGLAVRQSASHPQYWSVLGLKSTLVSMGVYGCKSYEKSIPAEYLTASVDQRLSLLQGLMDTDGYVGNKVINFDSTSFELASQVRELVQSLGGCAVRHVEHTGKFRGVEHLTVYRLGIKMPFDLCPFRLERKVVRWNSLIKNVKAAPVRRLRSVEQVGKEPVRCISVDASDHLYVTEDYLVTHNTQLVTQWGWHAAFQQGKNVYFSTSETVRNEVWMRTVARHSRLPQFGVPNGLNITDLQNATLSTDEKDVLHDVLEDMRSNEDYGAFNIAQIPHGGTLSFIFNRMKRANKLRKLDLAICDYLPFLTPEIKRANEREEFNYLLRTTKAALPAFDNGRGLPFISPWQIRREDYKLAVTSGAYTIGSLSDTSEADKAPDLVVSLLRPSPMANEATIQTLKARGSAIMQPAPVYLDYRNAYIGDSPSVGASSTESFDPFGVGLL